MRKLQRLKTRHNKDGSREARSDGNPEHYLDSFGNRRGLVKLANRQNLGAGAALTQLRGFRCSRLASRLS